MVYKAKKWLSIALIIILIGVIGASCLQTGFGKVRIRDLYILTSEQQYLHAQAYIPKEASSQNKLPVVVTAHGWLNTLEMQDAACIELSRRGCVVIAIDMYGHGLSGSNSETVFGGANGNAVVSGLGILPMVEYLRSGVMDFVDLDRIGIMGHSMGAQSCCRVLAHYGNDYNMALEAAAAVDSDGGTEITAKELEYARAQFPIAACLATGLEPDDDLFPTYDFAMCNLGFLHGAIEEAGRANTESGGESLDLSGDAQALRLVQSADPNVTSVELGKYYGSIEDKNMRVMYKPYSTHPLIHFLPNCTEPVISFFTDTLQLEPIPANNQLYFIKEIFNLIAFVGLIMLLGPVAAALLSCPFFKELQGEEGPRIPALTGQRKTRFWIGWCVASVLSFVVAWLAITINGPIMGFSGAIACEMTNHAFFGKLFSSPTTNCIAFWTLLMTIATGAYFVVEYMRDKKAGIRDESMVGYRISWRRLGKTILLAAMILGCIYAVVWFCKWSLNTDFRFWTPAIKTFKPGHVVYMLQYLPIFLAFYFVNSLVVNGANRFEDWSERKSLCISAIGNAFGAILLCVIQYGCLLINGYVVWADEWIGVLIIGLAIWQLLLAPFLLRRFYKLTGNNWLGAIVVSTLFVLSTVANTYICSAFML